MEREGREFAEQQDRVRLARKEDEKHIKLKTDIQAAAMERRAKITMGVLREKRMINSVNGLVQQAQIPGVRGPTVGRILGRLKLVSDFRRDVDVDVS